MNKDLAEANLTMQTAKAALLWNPHVLIEIPMHMLSLNNLSSRHGAYQITWLTLKKCFPQIPHSRLKFTPAEVQLVAEEKAWRELWSEVLKSSGRASGRA
jgi:hypothetical protein